METVIYDESEKFSQYNSDQFHYPYAKRKNNIAVIKFDTSRDYYPELNNFAYVYEKIQTQFKISQVCLENDYLDQLSILKILGSKGKEVINNVQNKDDSSDEEDEDEFECNGDLIEKIKYNQYFVAMG